MLDAPIFSDDGDDKSIEKSEDDVEKKDSATTSLDPV